MPKCILVTGGAGFIGSHLCEKLSQCSANKVYSLDNYFTGTTTNHVDGVTYIEGSTKNIDKLISFNPDIIYHLGEYSRVEQSFEDINIVWEYNKICLFAVLEFVRKTGAKLVYSGSSTKYGDGGMGRSQSPYAWTKASNTELITNYGNWFGISYAISYFYNVYGKREISEGKYATLIGLFRERMKNKQSLTVVNPGTQTRFFTHVDDVINALILIGESGTGDEYGIGCRENYSVIEIAEMFGGEIEYLEERQGNRMSSVIDTSKIEKLGWQPKIKISDYIESLKSNNWAEI